MLKFRIPIQSSDNLLFFASPETVAYTVSTGEKREIAEFLNEFVSWTINNKIRLCQDYNEFIHELAQFIVVDSHRNNNRHQATVDFLGALVDAIQYEDFAYFARVPSLNDSEVNNNGKENNKEN